MQSGSKLHAAKVMEAESLSQTRHMLCRHFGIQDLESVVLTANVLIPFEA